MTNHLKNPQKNRYEILDFPTEGLDENRTLTEYIKNTDFICGILDGSIKPKGPTKKVDIDELHHSGKIIFETNRDEESLQPPQMVVWLDKSARPVYWMVRRLWEDLSTKKSDGTIPSLPASKFLNIDRLPWLQATGINTTEIDADTANQFDINNLHFNDETPRQSIGKIRGLFVDHHYTDSDGRKHQLTEENFDDMVWRMPLQKTLQNQGELPPHLLVVDEVKSSGATINIAQQVLSAALPEVVVSTAHWQNGKSDELGHSIRRDIDLLARELGKTVLYRPSPNRMPQDQIKRIEEINSMSFADWQKKMDIIRHRDK